MQIAGMQKEGSMNKKGVLIIGVGAIARIHIEAYKSLSEYCEVRGVCDTFIEKAEEIVKEFGLVHAKAYKDYHEALKDDGIGVVSICLPPSLHCEMTVASLRSGKDVLCEKPMACSLEECDKMIAAAKESGKVLSIVCQNRFKTPMMKMKQLLASGILGPVLQGSIDSYWYRGGNYYDLWWRGTWANECGGCTTSHATHHIDLLQWYMGLPESVTAVMRNVSHDNSECEDLAMAICQYPKALVQLTASLVTHGEAQEIEFATPKATVTIPWSVKANKALENGFPEEDTEEEALIQSSYDNLPSLSEEGHLAQIRNFLSAIDGKAELLASGNDGRRIIELIMAIYKSSCTKTTVELPITPDDPFYKKESLVAIMPHFHEKTKRVDNFKTSKITLGREVGK